jgi:hypothetical protein
MMEWILFYYLIRQDLQDYSGLFLSFSSFQMKLEKLNPPNGGKPISIVNTM